MKIVYMGTPQFAVPALEALAAAGHRMLGVVTRTDKPAGRGKIVTPPPVKEAAMRLGIPAHQPKRVREPGFVETLRAIGPDVIVVAAYGQILPKDILTLPKLGCVNLHASLLPKYRGAAPINWAIINGEAETGVTLMQMDEGMDTGAVLLKESIPIGPDDTAGSLTAKLADLGSRMIVAALPLIEQGKLAPVPQRHEEATLAPLLKKEDGGVDWSFPADAIRNRMRGLSPWPGAYTFLDTKLVKLIEAEVEPGTAEPGALVAKDDALLAGTGSGMLRLIRIQPEGKKPMTAAEFLRGHRVAGKRFATSTKSQASNPK